MKKSWGLTDKILSGKKKIESRWYSMRCAPWDKIKKGETVYFKNSGESVKIKAKVDKVVQFADLTPKRVKEILHEFGGDIGIEKSMTGDFYERLKNKKYCVLIFLKNLVKIKSFEINKKGFGAMSAWVTINGVSKIKIL